MKESEFIAEYLRTEWALEVRSQLSIEEIREFLALQIRHLIEGDFNRLIQLLYRVDINEKRLKQMLNEQVEEDPAYLIAGFIIERQMQKVQTRKLFKNDNLDSDEERW